MKGLTVALSLILLSAASLPVGRAQTLEHLPAYEPDAPKLSATLDLPGPSTQTPPAWLGEAQFHRQGSLISADIPVSPVEAGRDLAVTLYYRGIAGGVARVWWQDNQGSEMLASSLDAFEGLPGQTTILLPGSIIRSSGLLVVQSSGPNLPVFRVRMEWVVPREVLANNDAAVPELFQSATPPRTGHELRGESPTASDVWQGSVITAPVTEGVVTANLNIESVVTLEATPARARIRFRLAGPSAETFFSARVNGSPWIPLSLDVPPLSDPGWFQDALGGWRYAGWREAVGWIPVTYLHAGDNSFIVESGAQAPELFAITQMELQLHYPSSLETARPRPVIGAVPSSTGPIPIQDAEPEPHLVPGEVVGADDLPLP
jgi:hypothetical protein